MKNIAKINFINSAPLQSDWINTGVKKSNLTEIETKGYNVFILCNNNSNLIVFSIKQD